MMVYYYDESCGLDLKVVKNLNLVWWGMYILSDDEDSSEVSEDSSDEFESDISSEFVSLMLSEGEYLDMEDNLVDVENNFGDVDGLYVLVGVGGDGLFLSVGLSSATIVAKKAVLFYVLFFDDVFGDDVCKLKGGLFDDVEGDDGGFFGGVSGKVFLAFAFAFLAFAFAKLFVVVLKKLKGLFDFDFDDDDGDLFGIIRCLLGGDLFLELIIDFFDALKLVEFKKIDVKTFVLLLFVVVFMLIVVLELKKLLMVLFDLDLDFDDGGFFFMKLKEVKKAFSREGLFD